MPGQLDRKQQQRLFGGLLVVVLGAGGVSLAPALRPPAATIDSGSQSFVLSFGAAHQDHAAALAALHQSGGAPGVVVTCRGRTTPLELGAESRDVECQTAFLSWVPLTAPRGAQGCQMVHRTGRLSAVYADAGGACERAATATPPVPPVVAGTSLAAEWQTSEVLVPLAQRPAESQGLLVTWTSARMSRSCDFGVCTPSVPG